MASPVNVGLPVACSLGSASLAARSEEVRRGLFAGARERIELDDGFALRFSGEGDWPARIAEFIASERRCCSFFRFETVFEPGLGPIWLTLTGPAGTKEFIAATFETPSVLA
jgi:hypothetical protein